jgi:DNA invertase Pin-like site-specific DNA recombinase
MNTLDDRSAATRKGLERARKFGRRPGPKPKVTDAEIRAVLQLCLGTAESAKMVGLSKPQFIARRRVVEGVGIDNG